MRIAQYLDDMILEREKANDALREELTKYVGWCQMLDQSQVSIFIFQSLSSISKGAISLAIIVLVHAHLTRQLKILYQVPEGLQELLTTTPESWK